MKRAPQKRQKGTAKRAIGHSSISQRSNIAVRKPHLIKYEQKRIMNYTTTLC